MTQVPGSSVPFETLIQHQGWVRALARRLVGESGADDVVQQTLVKAWQSPPATGESVRGWLATVARNFARQSSRAEARRAHWEAKVTRPGVEPSTADTLARAEAHQRVVAAVMSLEEPYRGTVLLRFFDGLPPREVSDRMGVPVETVRTRTRRAIDRLRKSLDDDYEDRNAWRLALLPLALPDTAGPPTGAGAGAAATAGAIAMSATMKKVAVGAAAMALLAFGGWMVVGPGGGSSPAQGPEQADVPDAAKRPSRRRAAGPVAAAPDVPRPPAAETPSREPDGSRVRIDVTRRDGGSTAGATIVLFSGEDALGIGSTDATGAAELPAPERDANVVVIVPGMPPFRAPGRWVAGEPAFAVSVPEGAKYAGLLRLDGGVPKDPIELHLSWDDKETRRELMPPSAWSALDDAGAVAGLTARVEFGRMTHRRPITAVTDAEGRFVFDGLPDVSGAQLTVSGPYVFSPGLASAQDVRVPRQDALIEIRSLPRLRGRIVYPGTSSPVAEARVEASYVDAKGRRGSHSEVLDSTDGRFAIALPILDLQSLDVTVSDVAYRGRRTVHVPRPDGLLVDLGDIEIGPTRFVTIRAVTPDGKPVPGALVTNLDTSRVLARDDDGDGSTRVRLSPETVRVRVGARGHGVVVVDVPVGAADQMRVELSPESWLTASILNQGEEPLEGMVLVVRSAAPMFTGEGDETDGLLHHVGAAQWMYDTGDEGQRVLTYPLDETGDLTIGGLRTDDPQGRPVWLNLTDAFGVDHANMLVMVEPGQQAGVTLVTRWEPTALRGTVRDAHGEPVGGARVHITAGTRDQEHLGTGGLSSFSRRTEADGSFAFRGLMIETAHLMVQKRGFAPVSVRDVALRGNAHPPEIVLRPGRTVRVTVVNDSGDPVTHARVHVFSEGLSNTPGAPGAPGILGIGDAKHLGDGVYEFVDLPQRTMRMSVQVGNEAYPFDHDTTVATVRRVLPPRDD